MTTGSKAAACCCCCCSSRAIATRGSVSVNVSAHNTNVNATHMSADGHAHLTTTGERDRVNASTVIQSSQVGCGVLRYADLRPTQMKDERNKARQGKASASKSCPIQSMPIMKGKVRMGMMANAHQQHLSVCDGCFNLGVHR